MICELRNGTKIHKIKQKHGKEYKIEARIVMIENLITFAQMFTNYLVGVFTKLTWYSIKALLSKWRE